MNEHYKKYPELNAYLMSLPASQQHYQQEWEAMKYMLEGKMFAMLGGDKEEQSILTLKLDPDHGEMLRREYTDIIPGYYMNKVHWNSIYLEGQVPLEMIEDLARESHQLILQSLSQKLQRQILSEGRE